MPTHKADLSQLTTTQLSQLTGRTPETVRKRLGEAGVEPVRTTGRTIWWSSRPALAAIYDTERLDLSAERAKLTRLQQEKTEMELAERRGELIPSGEVETMLVRLASTVTQRLRSVPTKVAPLAHSASSIAAAEQVIRQEVDSALSEIADSAEKYDPAA